MELRGLQRRSCCTVVAPSDPYEAELRPWNFVMIGLVFLALLVTATSTAFFTRAICAEVAGAHGLRRGVQWLGSKPWNEEAMRDD